MCSMHRFEDLGRAYHLLWKSVEISPVSPDLVTQSLVSLLVDDRERARSRGGGCKMGGRPCLASEEACCSAEVSLDIADRRTGTLMVLFLPTFCKHSKSEHVFPQKSDTYLSAQVCPADLLHKGARADSTPNHGCSATAGA